MHYLPLHTTATHPAQCITAILHRAPYRIRHGTMEVNPKQSLQSRRNTCGHTKWRCAKPCLARRQPLSPPSRLADKRPASVFFPTPCIDAACPNSHRRRLCSVHSASAFPRFTSWQAMASMPNFAPPRCFFTAASQTEAAVLPAPPVKRRRSHRSAHVGPRHLSIQPPAAKTKHQTLVVRYFDCCCCCFFLLLYASTM